MKILKGITVLLAMALGSASGLIQAFEFEDVTPEAAGFSSEKLSKIEERRGQRFQNESNKLRTTLISAYTLLDEQSLQRVFHEIWSGIV